MWSHALHAALAITWLAFAPHKDRMPFHRACCLPLPFSVDQAQDIGCWCRVSCAEFGGRGETTPMPLHFVSSDRKLLTQCLHHPIRLLQESFRSVPSCVSACVYGGDHRRGRQEKGLQFWPCFSALTPRIDTPPIPDSPRPCPLHIYDQYRCLERSAALPKLKGFCSSTGDLQRGGLDHSPTRPSAR